MKIAIDESIKQAVPNCRLGYVVIENAIVRGTPPALARELNELQEQVAKAYNPDLLPQTPRIISVRSMYKKLHFDPARYRPASEALVRRVLQNKGLYFVNSAVDVNNFCSLKYLLPFGIYDLGQVQGDIVYGIGPVGSYTSIAGDHKSTEGKPFLSDNVGPFGNPTADAGRTAATLITSRLLSVVYVDEEISEADLQEVLDYTADMLVRYNDGTVVQKTIVHA